MTLSEALREADREWETRMIPNGKKMVWKGHRLRFESEPDQCRGCFFEYKAGCPDCDEGAWVEDSPWCTGTPTEEGWYVLAIPIAKGLAMYKTDYLNKKGKFRLYDKRDVIAWRRIEPYKEDT